MALVGNISGSGGTYSTVGITGSVIFAYTDTPSEFPTLPQVGGDVVFFVSGSTTGKDGPVRNVAVFGGDTVVSGSLTIGSGSVKITSNDIQFSDSGTRIERNGNSIKFFDASNTSGVTLSTLVAGGGGGGGGGTNFFLDTAGAGKIYTTASTIAFPMGEPLVDEAADKGTGVVFYVSGSAAGGATSLFGGNVVTSGSLVTKTSLGVPAVTIGNDGQVSGSGNFSVGGSITLQGDLDSDTNENKTIFGSVTTSTITIGGGASSTVVIPGNLTVQGTTTTIDTTNLLVEDPIIYFGSGSTTLNQPGGIALASGSSVTHQALVWGRVANDTWGAGRLDVQNGTVTDFTSLTNYLPVRASKFEVGGANAYVSSSNAADLLVNYTTSTTFSKGGTNSLQISGYSGGNDPILTSATTGGDIFISGSRAALAHNQNSNVALFDNDAQYATFSTIGTGANTGLKIGSLVGMGIANPMTLSGSVVTVQAGSTVSAISSFPSHTLQAVVKRDTNNIFAVESDPGGNALLFTGGDLRLKANGNDFNFYGNNTNAFLSVTNDGADNAVISGFTTNGNVTLGSVGNGFTTISGSNVQLRFGSSNRVDFQRDGTSVARLGATSNVAPILDTAGVTNSTFTIGTSGGTTDLLALSGSAIRVNSTAGITVQKDGTRFLIISGTNDGAVFAAQGAGATPGSLTLTLTGSAVTVGSTSATSFNFAGGTALQVLGNATSATITSTSGRTTANVFDANATTVNAFGDASVTMGADGSGTTTIRNSAVTLSKATALNVNGANPTLASTSTGTLTLFNTAITGVSAFGAASTISIGAANGTLTSNVSIVPGVNNSYDLGTPSLRWRNMYTGDLHLKNERGNWTIIEEREYLSITNNITGKRYKFVLQEIE